MANDLSLAKYVGDALASPALQQQVAVGFAPWLDRTQFAGQCAIVASDPAMQNCDKDSLLRALLKCGQWGLIPGPARQVSLIVDRNGGVQVRPEFRGWAYIWHVSGWDVSAHLVHAGDDLQTVNTGPDEFAVTVHNFDPFDSERHFTEKTLRGGYLRGVNRKTGEVRFGFVPVAKILSSRSKAQTQNVWRDHFAEMAHKTLFHVGMSRGWFPSAAEYAAVMQGMAEADYERMGVNLDRATPTPATRTVSLPAPQALRAAAPRLQAEPMPTEPDEPAPVVEASSASEPAEPIVGWESDNDRKAFMADLGEAGWKYEVVATYCAAKGKRKVRPSAMTKAERMVLLDWVFSTKGTIALKMWEKELVIVQDLSSEPAPQPVPAPDNDPDMRGFFDEAQP